MLAGGHRALCMPRARVSGEDAFPLRFPDFEVKGKQSGKNFFSNVSPYLVTEASLPLPKSRGPGSGTQFAVLHTVSLIRFLIYASNQQVFSRCLAGAVQKWSLTILSLQSSGG